MLTNISASDQEWWLFISKPQKDDSQNEHASLEAYIENGTLFNMPLTVLIESEMKLIDIKKLLDNLTETNTKVSSSVVNSLAGYKSSATVENPIQNNDSKLTPSVRQPTVLKMAFLITQKNGRLLKINLITFIYTRNNNIFYKDTSKNTPMSQELKAGKSNSGNESN